MCSTEREYLLDEIKSLRAKLGNAEARAAMCADGARRWMVQALENAREIARLRGE